MQRHVFAYAMVGAFTLATGAAAQSSANAPATVEGCLLREQDVPGRKPNALERAGEKIGVGTGYILTNARVLKGTEPSAATAHARGDRAVGTSGAAGAPMFDVKGLKADLLKGFVGKRVEIDGTFADLERSPSAGPNEDLVDIKGTAIREVSGGCGQK
jgi:hypothetical protein